VSHVELFFSSAPRRELHAPVALFSMKETQIWIGDSANPKAGFAQKEHSFIFTYLWKTK
jgi:hypothetical protein